MAARRVQSPLLLRQKPSRKAVGRRSFTTFPSPQTRCFLTILRNCLYVPVNIEPTLASNVLAGALQKTLALPFEEKP